MSLSRYSRRLTELEKHYGDLGIIPWSVHGYLGLTSCACGFDSAPPGSGAPEGLDVTKPLISFIYSLWRCLWCRCALSWIICGPQFHQMMRAQTKPNIDRLSLTAMIDITYLVLILALVATNLSKLWALLCWLYNLAPVRRNRDLVPYYNRGGQLIGMVRMTPRNNANDPTPRNNSSSGRATGSQISSQISIPRAQTSLRPRNTPAAVALVTILTPSTWDGWPDGPFQCSFTPQNVADTKKLTSNWVCELLKGRRGSAAALTWQKGRELRRKCIGVLECSSLSCNFAMQIAPAVRGVDRHRQLCNLCPCGEQLRLRECGIESSLFLFRGGAFFINSGNHTHSKFTHCLIYRPHEPFEFDEYLAAAPIALDARGIQSDTVPAPSSDSEDSWHGIRDTDDDSDEENDGDIHNTFWPACSSADVKCRRFLSRRR
ncbi:hypothetical protein C8R47DRAFT_151131 [Mycena vitilis]|nr:hypothetical protein C8R47DRAFT_151131 [Mycena vitilis]